MDNFYLTLPSTASIENSQSSFVTHLVHPIQLTGEWEVGLAEAHVFHSWLNIDHSNNSFTVEYNGEIEKTIRLEHTFHVPAGKYTSVESVVRALSDAIPAEIEGVNLVYRRVNQMYIDPGKDWIVTFGPGLHNVFYLANEYTTPVTVKGIIGVTEFHLSRSFSFIRILHKTKTVKRTDPIRISQSLHIPVGWYEKSEQLFEAIRNKLPAKLRNGFALSMNVDETVTLEADPSFKVKFHQGMRDMLGFESDEFLVGKARGKYPIELRRGVYGIYVYTDIIQPQVVGNVFARLLRVLPVADNTKQKLIIYMYDRPDYYPLERNSFESVEIYLRTESGEPIVFRSGKTLVKLHFRRRRK